MDVYVNNREVGQASLRWRMERGQRYDVLTSAPALAAVSGELL